VKLTDEDARHRFELARVAQLATVGADGQPHVVPVTFAGQGRVVVIAVDHKPKSTTNLKRLRNIEATGRVSLSVDAYDDEDWSRLWWARADGVARVLSEEEDRVEPVAWLVAKYRQYRDNPPTGPVIWVDVATWRGWAYTG